MPRRGSDIAEFLYEALYNNRYHNLFWVNEETQLFCLKCIHGGNREWSTRDCQVFEDWRIKKKRRQTGKNLYSESRQRFLAAMNKCKLLRNCKKISTVSEKFYQFLNGADSERDDLSEVSGGDPSPEYAMDNNESNLFLSDETSAILTVLNSELNENVLYTSSDIQVGESLASSQHAIDPNLITDNNGLYTEAVDEQKFDVPVCLPDISEEKVNGVAEISMFNNSPVTTGEQDFELPTVVNFENPAATVGETLTPGSALKIPPEPQNLKALLPPVQLFQYGDYIIGFAKVLKP